MAVTSYTIGQTLLIAMVVVDMHDLGNVILETSDGRRCMIADATIKAAALALTAAPSGAPSVPSDTTAIVEVPGGMEVDNPS